MTLSSNDMDALRKLLFDAISKGTSKDALASTPGAKGLSPEASQVLMSLTPAQLDAFRSAYKTLKSHGASDADILAHVPIF